MNDTIRKHPLWRDTLEKMEPIEYGKEWTREWLEKALDATSDNLRFNMGLVHINSAIRSRGYKLTQRGRKGVSWFILPEVAIEDELKREQTSAKRCYQRAVELGSGVVTNPSSKLSDSQLQSLDHQIRVAASRLALVCRRISPNETKQIA